MAPRVGGTGKQPPVQSSALGTTVVRLHSKRIVCEWRFAVCPCVSAVSHDGERERASKLERDTDRESAKERTRPRRKKPGEKTGDERADAAAAVAATLSSPCIYTHTPALYTNTREAHAHCDVV